MNSTWQVCLHGEGMKAWRLLFSSVEALKPLVKLSLIISYGDGYGIDHGQKTVPAGEGRRDEEANSASSIPCHSLPDSCPCYYVRRRQEKW